MKVSKLHTHVGHRAALYALATGKNEDHVRSTGGDGLIVEWGLVDTNGGKVIAKVETQVFSLISIPEQKCLVAGNMNGGIHWVDLQEPYKTKNIQHHEKGVYDLKRHQQWLFSAGGEGVLTRWDLDGFRSLESDHLSKKALRSIAIAPARGELAVGASDGSIYVLDLETLSHKHVIANAHEPSVFTLQYSPDERYLLSGGRDAMLRVWDLEKGRTRHVEQPAHMFTINHIAFAPSGAFFATASRDRTIKIWDATSFKLLKVLEGIRDKAHFNSVNRLLWLNKRLISCSDDRSVILWETTI